MPNTGNRKIIGLSEESARKLVDKSLLLKRQERVLDVLRKIDEMKLIELDEISLVEQAEKLPLDSQERRIVEQRVEDIPKVYKGLKPSGSAVGGLIGAGLGGVIGYLIVGASDNKDRMAGTGLGAALGGAIGSFIGSLWDTGA
ncbi:MAG: glycine zipper 2TM domain-containing protein [Candidatus Thorarchaeota archaeon]